MPTQTQFGHTLFLHGFGTNSPAEKLTRLHFAKGSTESALYSEAWLQRLIMRQPSLLPVDQIEPAFSTLVPICVELPMLCGFLDNLLLTPNGDIVLVECKLWRNPEARREVVAQIIDYAKEISGWTYEKFEDAIRRAETVGEEPESTPRRLYDLAAARSEIDEAAFHDAVSRNLKRGRFLLLVVGDGIREGIEAMAEFLQQHAGFHFTLAFVEIALFQAPSGYIAQPRVLARTVNIERGIVTLDEGRISFKPPASGPLPNGNGARRTTITQDRYFERLERDLPGSEALLTQFLDQLAALDVYAEYGAESMILRWRPVRGREWNVGTISKHGQVWLDYFGAQANGMGLLYLHKQYLDILATLATGAYVQKTKKETGWYVTQDGRGAITVDKLLSTKAGTDKWTEAIAAIQKTVSEKLTDE
jgi:hypothetical protein